MTDLTLCVFLCVMSSNSNNSFFWYHKFPMLECVQVSAGRILGLMASWQVDFSGKSWKGFRVNICEVAVLSILACLPTKGMDCMENSWAIS